MKILFASTPVTGHVNPMLAAASILADAGHATAFYTGGLFREKAEAVGARFYPLPPDVDYDVRNAAAAFPQLGQCKPGPERTLATLQLVFVDSMSSQFRGLKAVLNEFPADLIIHETTFCGVLPLLLGPRSARPASVYLNNTSLLLPREDGAPVGPGSPALLPTTDAAQRAAYRAIAQDFDATITRPIVEYTNQILHELKVAPLPAPLLESVSILSDLMLQPSVPGFEYPLCGSHHTLRFIGALFQKGSGELPTRIKEAKEAGRKIVLVSQGTIANMDLGQLVAPAIRAFGEREDLLLVITTGGRPVDSIPWPLSANTLAALDFDFEKILPYVDVLVAFGGYGTITQALSFGVPMALGGLGQDKPQNAARVAWLGCGIDLGTETPTVEQLRKAVNELLAKPSYRDRAEEIAREFASHDPARELTDLLEALVAVR